MPRPHEQLRNVVVENRRQYELVVSMVRHYAAEGDEERVLRAAMLAANYAWRWPVGLLSDLRLERAVVRAVQGSGTVTVDGGRHGGRVLHVLSEAYSIGGHTRLAWRWMSRDERTSDVVLTNQHGPVPDPLIESVQATGGTVVDLRSTEEGLLGRARLLREHMDRADLVVLHVHPYDVVALAAANLPGVRPPIVYENHADLGFWLGVAAADLLCDLRPTVRDMDVRLRRVSRERIAVLPMPVEAMVSTEGPDLRRQLGIRPGAVVALTVSDEWKVAAPGRRGMHEVVDKVLSCSPQLTYVLVGVRPNPQWVRLARRYPGRVLVTGKVLDTAPFFAVADIYLESYPSFSGTTPLEAAMLGLPVVGVADIPGDEPAHVLQRWSPGLDGRPTATSAGRVAVAVRRLAADPELRRREAAETEEAVRAVHDNPGWRRHLEGVYERARSMSAVSLDDGDESPTDDAYAVVLLTTVNATEVSVDPRGTVQPLGDLYDGRLAGDLTATLLRDQAASVQVRVAPAWEDHPAWTARLLDLAARHARLRVSLPFVADDDVRGTRSVARLTEILAQLGLTTDDCGDVGLETDVSSGPPVGPGHLARTDEALDRVEELVASSLWAPEPTHPAEERRPVTV